jgi:hypothetical protein
MTSLIGTLVPTSCGVLVGLAGAIAWAVFRSRPSSAYFDLLIRLGLFVVVLGISYFLVSTQFQLDVNVLYISVGTAFTIPVVIYEQLAEQKRKLAEGQEWRNK